MMSLVAVTGLTESERIVSGFGILAIISFLVWSFFRWMQSGPRAPDPWDDQLSVPENDDGPQVCHRCLEEHAPSAQLCPHCGAMVGPCASFVPPLYLYSIGPTLCAGTSGSRRSPFITFAFIAISFAVYVAVSPLFFLAPVYWAKLLKAGRSPSTAEGNDPNPASQLPM